VSVASPKIAISSVAKTFVQHKGSVLTGHVRHATQAIGSVSLSIQQNEFVSIVGPSGCGKTTLLRIIAGLIPATSGQVVIDGSPVRRPRRGSAMVFQYIGLMPWRTIEDNVLLAIRFQHHRSPTREDRELARHYLDLVGLSGFEGFYPHQLSGGMQQRVGIARALATRADVLLMDEPFGALDAQTRLILQDEFLRLCEQYQATVVFITHDIDEAIHLSDRVVTMSQRPGTIKRIIEVDLPKPRYEGDDRENPRFIELRHQIWDELRSENVEDLAGAASAGHA
jgi:NitT/TauT family transport system ATP-binding protein